MTKRKHTPDTAPGIRPPRPVVPEDNNPKFMIGYGPKPWYDLLIKCVTDAGIAMSVFMAAAHGGYLRQVQTRAFIGCRRAMEGDKVCVEQIILEYRGRNGSKEQGTNQALESLLGMMRAPRPDEIRAANRAVATQQGQTLLPEVMFEATTA
jgi:hypothetical protein